MTVSTALPIQVDRSVHPRLAADFGRLLESSGVVDYAYVWDQLMGWWPPALWSEEFTAHAAYMKDCDSYPSALVLAGIIAGATENLGLIISTDAARSGPAELTQAMLTLAAATDGRALAMVGSGEAKQIKPFGHARGQGLARLEDHLRIFRLLLETDGPADYDGNVWSLRQGWVGGARPHRPKIWAMGAGPKLLELGSRYADGFGSAVPGAFASPEQLAEQVTRLRQAVEREGRDPAAFEFGVYALALIHEDPEVIERSYGNPLLRWLAATVGRLAQADWLREGITPVLPSDWHYALNLYPAEWSKDQALDVCDQVTEPMLAKAFLSGSPKEVAESLRAYAEAGATIVSPVDLLPLVLPLDEALSAVSRSIDVCAQLKV